MVCQEETNEIRIRRFLSSHTDGQVPLCKHPLVLVPGFLAPSAPKRGDGGGGGWYRYWGEITADNFSSRPLLNVWPCGFASLHDRACEVFYQIKGGRVDYGEEHSRKFGHARYGRTHKGLFRQWSSENPIHVLGHSLGGATVRYLQHLLQARAFPGHETDADWILSLSALSAPLNGTLTTYALGEEEEAPPRVKRLSPGSILGSLVHVFAMAGGRLLGYELGLEQWQLSWREVGAREAMRRLVRSVMVHSELVEEEDNAAYDTTMHAMKAHNEQMGGGHPSCFYFSFVGTSRDANRPPAMATSDKTRTRISSFLVWSCAMIVFLLRRCFLLLLSWKTSRRRYEKLKGLGIDVEEWKRGGDGLCPCSSQRFPLLGVREEVSASELKRERLGELRSGGREKIERENVSSLVDIAAPAPAPAPAPALALAPVPFSCS
eukprot:764193-Hanusia_phi.AAC.2